jgi:four helix bundle protein
MAMSYRFAHETLDCYRLAVEVANWFQRASFPRGRAELKKQALDASSSIVLNIAEGSGRRHGTSDAGKNHHDIALGSAAECCAILDLVAALEGATDQQQNLRRIGAMLAKMRR